MPQTEHLNRKEALRKKNNKKENANYNQTAEISGTYNGERKPSVVQKHSLTFSTLVIETQMPAHGTGAKMDRKHLHNILKAREK